MKTFIRWLYAIILYILVTIGICFGMYQFISGTTRFPFFLASVRAAIGGGLNIWIMEVVVTVALLAATSLLLFGLWNLAMCSSILGKYPLCESAVLYNWLFIFLHTMALLFVAYYMLGIALPFFIGLPFLDIVVYFMPIAVYSVIFFFVSRILAPKTCYKFRHLWKVRRGIGLV